jgi:hypothetical protein
MDENASLPISYPQAAGAPEAKRAGESQQIA